MVFGEIAKNQPRANEFAPTVRHFIELIKGDNTMKHNRLLCLSLLLFATSSHALPNKKLMDMSEKLDKIEKIEAQEAAERRAREEAERQRQEAERQRQEAERQRQADADRARQQSSGYSSRSTISSGSKRYSCEFMCRGSLFATGGRHTFEVSANSRDAAQDAIKSQANDLCRAEGRSQSGAWWADMSLCNEK
jgi:hypothetical protein